MKKFIFFMILVISSFSVLNAEPELTSCMSNDCLVAVVQYENSWELTVNCEGTPPEEWSGSGEYGGIICGGVETE